MEMTWLGGGDGAVRGWKVEGGEGVYKQDVAVQVRGNGGR